MPLVSTFDAPQSLDSCSAIRWEILRYGPVAATYQVFPDFLAASDPARGQAAFAETGGIYIRRPGQSAYGGSSAVPALGYHAVVIVGWGQTERDKLQYWICRNSWGERWGDKGYFQIAMSQQTNSGELVNDTVGLDVPLVAFAGGNARPIHLGGVAFCRVRDPRENDRSLQEKAPQTYAARHFIRLREINWILLLVLSLIVFIILVCLVIYSLLGRQLCIICGEFRAGCVTDTGGIL
jgi:hypothetical protein